MRKPFNDYLLEVGDNLRAGWSDLTMHPLRHTYDAAKDFILDHGDTAFALGGGYLATHFASLASNPASSPGDQILAKEGFVQGTIMSVSGIALGYFSGGDSDARMMRSARDVIATYIGLCAGLGINEMWAPILCVATPALMLNNKVIKEQLKKKMRPAP
jgi:hypothetical protein